MNRTRQWSSTQRIGRHATDGECTDHPGPRFLARRVGVGRSRRHAPGRRPRRHGADAAGTRVEGRRPVLDHLRGPRRRDHRRHSRRPGGRPSSPSTARPGSAATRRATRCRSGSRRWSTSIRRPGSRRSTRSSPMPRSRSTGHRSTRRRTSTGLSEEQKATFRERAVPVPGAMLREGYTFTNDARRDIPSTIIATGYTAADYQKYAKEHPDWAFLAGIPELRNVTLDRPADQPLADVVEAGGAREDHRRRRDGRRRRRGDGRPPRRRDGPPHLGDRTAHRRVRGADAGATRDAGARDVWLRSSPRWGTSSASDGWYLSFLREGRHRSTTRRSYSVDELRSAITSNGAAWMELLAEDPDPEHGHRRSIGDGWWFHSPIGVPPRPGRPPRHRSPQPGLHGADEPRRRAARHRRLGLRPGDRSRDVRAGAGVVAPRVLSRSTRRRRSFDIEAFGWKRRRRRARASASSVPSSR